MSSKESEIDSDSEKNSPRASSASNSWRGGGSLLLVEEEEATAAMTAWEEVKAAATPAPPIIGTVDFGIMMSGKTF